ncbi:unnamed protein product, partial [Symbiodinium microadriaticum]
DFPGAEIRPAGQWLGRGMRSAGAVEAEGSVPLREDSEASSQGIMSLPLEDLGLQSEDLASQRERGSGFTVNEDPSSGSVYAGIPALPLKRTSAPQAVPVTREKKDEKEESARSSRRSSVSSVVAESIEEIGMEPMAKDASYGRALSAEMVPPTSQQDSAEAGQGDSTPGAEPVTRQKKDEKEESARSSRRSSVSSSVAESIEEIGMEPVARGRALSVEMAPPTAKESSAEAAQVGPLPGADPVTREKKDEKESARSSRRSSVSSFMAESIEEIGMEPVARDTSYGRAMSVEMSLPTAKPSSAEATQAGPLAGEETVSRQKQESARSSRRSSMSSSVAESIEEIGVEPVARGRALSVEMAPPTAKESSAEAAQVGPLPVAEPVTREKKDEKE